MDSSTVSVSFCKLSHSSSTRLDSGYLHSLCRTSHVVASEAKMAMQKLLTREWLGKFNTALVIIFILVRAAGSSWLLFLIFPYQDKGSDVTERMN